MYQVVYAETIEALAAEVSAVMDRGGIPTGGIATATEERFSPNNGMRPVTILMQAVVMPAVEIPRAAAPRYSGQLYDSPAAAAAKSEDET